MSELGPGNMFDGLDDPTPPAFSNDLLPGVLQRGHRLRQQRRLAYAVGSACAGVLIAGTAVGLTASTNNNGRPVVPLSPSPTHHHSKKPHHHPKSPGAQVGGSQPGATATGGKHHTPTCASPTPTDTATATPTPTDTTSSLLYPTDSPTPTPEDTAPAAAVNTTCPSPSPTDSSTGSPEPTYPPLPILTEDPQPSSGISRGTR